MRRPTRSSTPSAVSAALSSAASLRTVKSNSRPMTLATPASRRPRSVSRSSRPAITARTACGMTTSSGPVAGSRPSSMRTASTTMNGFPALTRQTVWAIRVTTDSSRPARISARTRAIDSRSDSAASDSDSERDCCASCATERRSTRASASSSTRKVPMTSTGQSGIRRERNTSNLRLMSSAQCRSSSTTISGCPDARYCTTRVMASKSRT
jgi:hypothetical protein